MTDDSNVAKEIERGQQRSKLHSDLGNGIGLAGVLLAVVAGIYYESLPVALAVLVVGVGAGIWVSYSTGR
jgi:hypothetical protein